MDSATVAPGLFEGTIHRLVLALGLHDPHSLQPDKEDVISPATFAGPLGNGEVAPFFGAGARLIGEVAGVSLPACFAQLVVNQGAGLRLAEFHTLGGLLCSLYQRGGRLGRYRLHLRQFCFGLLTGLLCGKQQGLKLLGSGPG